MFTYFCFSSKVNPSYGRGLHQTLVLEMSDRKLSSSQDNKTNKKTKTDPPFPRTAKYSKMNEGDPEEVGSDRGAVSILKSDD